jgi:hypothetical protein
LRPLPIVPPPAEGESLGSWLGRIGARYGVGVSRLLVHLGIRAPRPQDVGPIDLPPLTVGQLELLSVRLRRSLCELAVMNAPRWAASRHGEHAFCRRCLAEDRAQKGSPFWRRGWLDAFAVWCHRHQCRLQAVSASSCERQADWEAWLRHLSESGQQSEPRSESVPFVESLPRAAFLQAGVGGELAPEVMSERYGLRLGVQLRDVAVDVLDVLLTRQPGDQAGPALIRLAALLNVRLDAELFRVQAPYVRPHLITQLKRFDARLIALVVADALLAPPCKDERPPLVSIDSLRDPWLPILLPTHAKERLRKKARCWPAEYVDQRWPELTARRAVGTRLPPAIQSA